MPLSQRGVPATPRTPQQERLIRKGEPHQVHLAQVLRGLSEGLENLDVEEIGRYESANDWLTDRLNHLDRVLPEPARHTTPGVPKEDEDHRLNCAEEGRRCSIHIGANTYYDPDGSDRTETPIEIRGKKGGTSQACLYIAIHRVPNVRA